jgi:hypothetical protein
MSMGFGKPGGIIGDIFGAYKKEVVSQYEQAYTVVFLSQVPEHIKAKLTQEEQEELAKIALEIFNNTMKTTGKKIWDVFASSGEDEDHE